MLAAVRTVLAVAAEADADEQPGVAARLEVLPEGAPANAHHGRHLRAHPDPVCASSDWHHPAVDVSGWPLAEAFGVHADPPRDREP